MNRAKFMTNVVAHIYIQRAFERSVFVRNDLRDAILLVTTRSRAASNWIRRYAEED
jgi:hypothetical protein